ncbi:hypothetical protein HDU76_009038, partial [Blyttiomyces sp. JEL0837]
GRDRIDNEVDDGAVYVKFEAWEWWFDRRNWLDFRVNLIPRIGDVFSAERVALKLGQDVGFEYLKSVATFGAQTAFKLLWEHLTSPLLLGNEHIIEQLDSATAMQLLAYLTPNGLHGWTPVDIEKIRYKHSVDRSTLKSNSITDESVECSQHQVEWIIKSGYPEHIKAILQVCKRASINWVNALGDVVKAGNLSLVQYFHNIRPDAFSTVTMDIAASTGHPDILRFLHEIVPTDAQPRLWMMLQVTAI